MKIKKDPQWPTAERFGFDPWLKVREIMVSMNNLAHLTPLFVACEGMDTRLRTNEAGQPPKKPGRKFMNTEERRQVSERMKKAWRNRRHNDRLLTPDEIRERTEGVPPGTQLN
jgi:hypothetical protein